MLLKKFEKKIYSQNGEDGIIAFLLDCVGRGQKYYVEFGAEDGQECNTRYLREHAGFTGLLMDGGNENRAIGLYREMVTRENINDLFEKYGVPTEFELLSIDVDGNDLWLWDALSPIYRPRIVIIEYNGVFPPPLAVTVPYALDRGWDGTCFMGASLAAIAQVAAVKGYTLVGCNSSGVNAFFIRNDYRKNFLKSFNLPTLEEAFIPATHANYCTGGTTRYEINGYVIHGHLKFDQSERQMLDYPSGQPIIVPELDQGIFIPIEQL